VNIGPFLGFDGEIRLVFLGKRRPSRSKGWPTANIPERNQGGTTNEKVSAVFFDFELPLCPADRAASSSSRGGFVFFACDGELIIVGGRAWDAHALRGERRNRKWCSWPGTTRRARSKSKGKPDCRWSMGILSQPHHFWEFVSRTNRSTITTTPIKAEADADDEERFRRRLIHPVFRGPWTVGDGALVKFDEGPNDER